jgi:prevent-host-death family protein
MVGNGSVLGRSRQEKYEHIWMRGYIKLKCGARRDLTGLTPMCNMRHMKTISLRELHNKTGKWMRRVADEEQIMVTDRGVPIAKVVHPNAYVGPRRTWGDRKLMPGYAALMKAGKLKSTGDSSVYISEDRSSRDNSVAGIEE